MVSEYKYCLEEIEELKQEIAELQHQIEKMKICGNCKNIRTEKCIECVMTMRYDNWELKESD